MGPSSVQYSQVFGLSRIQFPRARQGGRQTARQDFVRS